MISAQRKKEMMVPIRLIVIMFFFTLFICLTIETEADRFASRRFFYLLVISWQIIFGLIALAKIKRPALFYLFSTLFLLPLVIACIVLSYLILYPFIFSNKVLAVSLMLIGSVLNFYLSFLGFGHVFMETLQENIASGKFDLSEGIFSFSIAPKMLDFRSTKLKKISNFLMVNLGVIVFIGPIVSFYVSKSSSMNFKDVYGGIICYFMAMVIGWAASGSLYNYCWIRRWEKERGRNMVARYV